ncbi:hypothetical protein PMAYCL1PPCAC_08595 [Pristionchus mayeri]|uniref:Carboxylic ester hydrolase n=1 Tax=Pristionchus mayeri TaxID=1317129 RepID=A0AAN4ZJZ3_9BILA|nr:hypothetical protein PMAYCL1PPCAC_08595 [Pristionchus mayeri]
MMLLLLILLPISAANLITVDTSRGTLRGFDHGFGNDQSQPYYGYGQVFLGIPYAKPPLGERRFTLPEDICQYNEHGDVHDATYYRPRCYQIHDDLQPAPNMSEDCLYLNVVTPNVNGSFPVMVYIHGGGLQTGGADVYHWKGTIRNLVSRGVVVVTIQYRLGLIGFFTTYTEKFPPNRGYYDQMLTLTWVQEEIKNFGGDPYRVTIFGQSAGAGSSSDLSLSPVARGLFHQLIQTSGSVLLKLETPEDPRGSIHKERARQICNIDDSNWSSNEKDDAIMKCLLAASPEQLIEYDGRTSKGWNPTLDGAFFPDYPQALANKRPKYPVIVTDMLNEYAYFLPGAHQNDISTIGPDTSMDLFKSSWPNYDQNTVERLNDLFLSNFSNGPLPATNDHLGWSKLVSDIWSGFLFDAFMVRDVEWHKANGNKDIWLFTFAHSNKLGIPIDLQGWIPVGHCSELPYLWFYPEVWDNASVALTDVDFAVAEHMGRIYTNFAIDGELAYERAGDNRKYLEIELELTPKMNWNQKTDDVFNKEMIAILGEFPPISISLNSWDMLHTLGKKVLKTWDSMECPDPEQSPSTTTQSGSSIGSLPALIFALIALIFV